MFVYHVFLLVAMVTHVHGDYDCLCNYAVENAVYPAADTSIKELGYLYEFDCKPVANIQDSSGQFFTVLFKHQVGYVAKSEDVTSQICSGEMPTADILTTTTVAATSTTATTTAAPTTAAQTTTAPTTAAPTAVTTTEAEVATSTRLSPTEESTVPPTSSSSTTTMKATTISSTAKQTSTRSTTSEMPTTTHKTTTTHKATTEMPTTTHKTTTEMPTTTHKATTTHKTTTEMPTTTNPPTQTTTTTTRATTTPVQYWQTAANITGTVYEKIGLGYNLLGGNPSSNPDPGYNMSGRIFQLSGNASMITELSHQRFEYCPGAQSTVVILGSKSYQRELDMFAQPSAAHDMNLRNEAFTLSPEFESLRPSFENTNNVFIDRISTCKVETIRYLTENAEQNGYSVSREFAKAVCKLPTGGSGADDMAKYLQFLDTWGTSIVTSVDIGTRTIQRTQTTPQDLFLHMQYMDPSRIQHSGELYTYKSSITIDATNIESSPALNAASGTPHSYTTGTKQQPEVIGVKLNPISDALNWTFWKSIEHELAAEGVCPDSLLTENTFNTYVNYMNIALKQYAAFKHATSGYSPVKDHAIQVPITWPVGTYGFMESAYGCPDDGQITWLKGTRHQDTEDVRSHNAFTYHIQNYMKGTFGSNNIDSYYCIKNRHNISPYDQQWPRGTYCLLKKGSCPSGFRSGYIYWDDDDVPNHNSRSGTLPDGTYDKNTKIYYCCRSDGSTQTAIYLPTERPFILVRYGTTCQTVHGMTKRDLFVKWDDEDVFNKDSAGGMHPKDDGDSKNHRLHFCYYQSSAHGPSLIEPNSTLTPIGYMYEFDCKPLSSPQQINGYFIIHYAHQVAYLPAGVEDQLQVQICQGDIPTDDMLTTLGTPIDTDSHTNTGKTTPVSIVHTSTAGTSVNTNTTYITVTADLTNMPTTETANNTLMTTDSTLAAIANVTEYLKITLPELNTTGMPLGSSHTSSSPDTASNFPPTIVSRISSGLINGTSSTNNVTTTSSTGSVFLTPTSNETKPLPDIITGTESNATDTTVDTFELTTESGLDSNANTTESASQILTAVNTTTITSNPLTVISSIDSASRIQSTASSAKTSNHSSLANSYNTTTQSSMNSTLLTSTTTSVTSSISNITTDSVSNGKENTTEAFNMSTETSEISSTVQSSTISRTNSSTQTDATFAGIPTNSSILPIIISTSTSVPSTTTIPSTTQPSTLLPTTQLPQTTTEAPITWPSGTYGLMQATQGCPDDGYTTWSEGWRKQDTEGALIGGNDYTYGIDKYMKGTFGNNIETYFCMKRRHVSNTYDREWPSGSYCILKYGPCPKGFSSGSVFWDDVGIINHDDKGGSLPEGTYTTETEIFYCCRDDGPVSTGIVLPTSRPFILLRYRETCQTVKGMSAYDIFIYWDDQNFFNSDKATGMHPFDDGDSKNHKLHFCYYSASSGTGVGLIGR